MKWIQMRYIGGIIALCVVCLTAPVRGLTTVALAESKAEVTEYRKGKAISPVNVREGAGKHNPKVTVHKKDVVLTKGMPVTILGETKVSGKVWYHVKLKFDGQEVTGYSSGAYIQLVEEAATLEPTKTPTITPTIAPTVVVTQEVTPTLKPTVTFVVPEKETVQKPTAKESSSFKGVYIFALIVAILLVIAGIIYYIIRLMYRPRERDLHTIQSKVENLKQMKFTDQPKTEPIISSEHPKIGKRSEIFDGKLAEEASDVYLMKKEKDLESSKEENFITGFPSRKDTADVLKMIEQLKEHDIVYHKDLGRGEVFDNSDVKLIEIRFKVGDSRFFNKKDLAKKNLICKVEKKAV